MIKMTEQDKRAMGMTCDCIRNCKKYGIQPAPYFPLLIRMFWELERLGAVEWEDEALSMKEMNT